MIVGEGEAEIFIVGFAETPHVPKGVAGHSIAVGIHSEEIVNRKVT
jgi:hypothetical protein